jgi:hypothetical protein
MRSIWYPWEYRILHVSRILHAIWSEPAWAVTHVHSRA